MNISSFKRFIILETNIKLREQVIDIISKNDRVSIDILAKILNVSKEKVEDELYSILSDFFNKGYYNKSKDDIEVDENELKMGINIEMEHTSCPVIAKRIALDHLTEISNYYTLLKEMEDNAKKERG